MNDKNNRNNRNENLHYLDELSDYEVSDSDKDVRGWTVKDANDNTIGEVDNLLVSKANNKVVYLDVEVDKSILEENQRPYSATAEDSRDDYRNKEGENHVIVPIGMAHLNTDDDIVTTSKISRDIFARTKRIKKGSRINRDYETNVLESYSRSENTTFTDDERKADDTTLYDRTEYSRENQGSKETY